MSESDLPPILPIRSESEQQAIPDDVLDHMRSTLDDPVWRLMMYARGDVVALGLMTLNDFKARRVKGADGETISPAGQDAALNLIPMAMRYDASKELAKYVYAKPVAGDNGKTVEVSNTTFVLPHNNRCAILPPGQETIE